MPPGSTLSITAVKEGHSGQPPSGISSCQFSSKSLENFEGPLKERLDLLLGRGHFEEPTPISS